jgi:hypothetical protein
VQRTGLPLVYIKRKGEKCVEGVIVDKKNDLKSSLYDEQRELRRKRRKKNHKN